MPEDVSIIGSGGGEIRNFSDVRLTMVKQPVTEMGETAANMIIRMITEKTKYFEGIELPARVIEGCTTLLRPRKKQLK